MNLRILIIVTTVIALLPLACVTGPDGKRHLDGQKIDAFFNSPTTKAITGAIIDSALNIGLNALGNQLDDKGLSSLAFGVRTLEGRNLGHSQMAQVVSSFQPAEPRGNPAAATATLIAANQGKGVPDIVVKEAVARGLDSAAEIAHNLSIP